MIVHSYLFFENTNDWNEMRKLFEVEHPRYTFTTLKELWSSSDEYLRTWNYIPHYQLIFKTMLIDFRNIQNIIINRFNMTVSILVVFLYFQIISINVKIDTKRSFLCIFNLFVLDLKVLTHPISIVHRLCTVSKNNIMYKDS